MSRQVGRGAFVRDANGPAILIVETDATAAFLAEYVRNAGYRALVARQAGEALALLADDLGIVLVLCSLRAPTIEHGQEIIQAEVYP